MLRTILTPILSLFLSTAALAEDAPLQRLNTGDDSRGWEAVGRLELDGKGFCTGALIAPDLVLTAAHCLFDSKTQERIDHSKVEFLADWRNGRASAYRDVRRAVVHPDYVYDAKAGTDRVRNDVALLELFHPIRNTTVIPFETTNALQSGDQVGVVSYAHDRAEAPSFQKVCGVLGQQQGVYIMSCNIDFGSSGAPIFSFGNGRAQIVSLVSAKAKVNGQQVALGMSLEEPLKILKAELEAGGGVYTASPEAPRVNKLTIGSGRNRIGAKFVSVNGG